MFFKAKDYVTAGNALCGLAGVVCVMHGQIYYAGVLILVSWIFDALDGVVARLTNTFNKFDPSSPFGGYKESGLGREGGLHGLMPYVRME